MPRCREISHLLKKIILRDLISENAKAEKTPANCKMYSGVKDCKFHQGPLFRSTCHTKTEETSKSLFIGRFAW